MRLCLYLHVPFRPLLRLQLELKPSVHLNLHVHESPPVSEFPAMPKLIFEIRIPNSELKTHLPSAIFADFLIFILILILIEPVALNSTPET